MSMVVLLAAVLDARAFDTARIPPHTLAVDDGGVLTPAGPFVVAMVGNLRSGNPALDNGRVAVAGIGEAIAHDVLTAGSAPPTVVLLGDVVRSSSAAEWSDFARAWAPLLDSKEVATANAVDPTQIGPIDNPGLTVTHAAAKVSAVPDGLAAIVVAGDRDGASDSRYEGLGASFPGVGVEIGANRVATWYSFDVHTDGVVWRFVVLDSNKALLGSRWGEQTRWFASVLEGTYDQLVLFEHDGLYNLAGGGKNGPDMDPGGAVTELLKVVDDHAELNKLRAVFAAGAHADQAFLPDGPFGVLFVNAGGGGAPAEDVQRWGERRAPGTPTASRRVQLEPMFDLALMAQLERKPGVSEDAVDAARAQGEYKGLVGTYRAKDLPTFGWWEVSVKGGLMNLVFHAWREDRGLAPIYTVLWQRPTGWVARKL
jgi:hypothetical protein